MPLDCQLNRSFSILKLPGGKTIFCKVNRVNLIMQELINVFAIKNPLLTPFYQEALLKLMCVELSVLARQRNLLKNMNIPMTSSLYSTHHLLSPAKVDYDLSFAWPKQLDRGASIRQLLSNRT